MAPRRRAVALGRCEPRGRAPVGRGHRGVARTASCSLGCGAENARARRGDLGIEGYQLLVKAASFDEQNVRAVLTRDARRSADGFVSDGAPSSDAQRSDTQPDLAAKVHVTAAPRDPEFVLGQGRVLVNGVFGDPLLHIRLRHLKRSLLFDLGDSARLPARIVHQVSDVFISHAHFDHIGGFLWFLTLVSRFPRITAPLRTTRTRGAYPRDARWHPLGPHR